MGRKVIFLFAFLVTTLSFFVDHIADLPFVRRLLFPEDYSVNMGLETLIAKDILEREEIGYQAIAHRCKFRETYDVGNFSGRTVGLRTGNGRYSFPGNGESYSSFDIHPIVEYNRETFFIKGSETTCNSKDILPRTNVFPLALTMFYWVN